MAGKSVIHLELMGEGSGAEDAFGALDGVDSVKRMPAADSGSARFDVDVLKGYDLRETVFKTAVDKGWTILEMHQDKTNLEDVFRQLTKSQGG